MLNSWFCTNITERMWQDKNNEKLAAQDSSIAAYFRTWHHIIWYLHYENTLIYIVSYLAKSNCFY